RVDHRRSPIGAAGLPGRADGGVHSARCRFGEGLPLMKIRPARIQRSELAVPATSIPFFEKADRGPADSLFLDLEDAVAPARRDEARANAVNALNDVDWGAKTVSVRVNGLTTPWAIADILAVARCPRLDMILLPKVETAGDVEFLDRLLTGLELETPRERPL